MTAYMTTRDAAKRLGVSLRTAQMWCEAGVLEAWKTEGGHRRITCDSVERLLAPRPDSGGLPVPGAMSEPVPVKPVEDERIKVLVVEDDNVLIKLYRMCIDVWKLPIDVLTVSNGCEALILVGRERPDLMICDLNLPFLDGFQMIRTLVGSPFREGMEIVAVSGLDDDDVTRRGGLPETVARFSKPVPFDALRRICERLLARRRELRAAMELSDGKDSQSYS